MTTYRVTAVLSQRELIDYFDANGKVDVNIEVVTDQSDKMAETIYKDPVTLPKKTRRRKRGSKVVETILDRIGSEGDGADTADLRLALEKAGLSSNSLSSGLAILQKDGRIKREDDGSYVLAAAA